MKTLLLSAVLAMASLSVAPPAKADLPATATQTFESLRADLAAKDAYIVKLEAYADALEMRLAAVEAQLKNAPAQAQPQGLDLRLMPSVQRAMAQQAQAAARAAPDPSPTRILIHDAAGKVIGSGHTGTAYGPAQVYMRR